MWIANSKRKFKGLAEIADHCTMIGKCPPGYFSARWISRDSFLNSNIAICTSNILNLLQITE